jgi:hypothetical protein
VSYLLCLMSARKGGRDLGSENNLKFLFITYFLKR